MTMAIDHFPSVAIVNPAALVLHDSRIARYLNAGSLIALYYETFITFDDEVNYVWSQKNSMAKWLYLGNKYAGIFMLTVIAFVMNNYDEFTLTNKTCAIVTSVGYGLGVICLMVANVLVTLRVVTLWNHYKTLKRVLCGIFVLSFLCNFTLMAQVLYHYHDRFKYSAYARTCYVEANSEFLPGVWASPLLFEAAVLTSVAFNALWRPRLQTQTLRAILYYDGFLYFGCITIVRVANVVISVEAPRGIASAMSCVCWAFVTTILSRSTIASSKAAALEQETFLTLTPTSESMPSAHFHERKLSDGFAGTDATLLGPEEHCQDPKSRKAPLNRPSKLPTSCYIVSGFATSQAAAGKLPQIPTASVSNLLFDETPGLTEPPLYEIIDDKRREALAYKSSQTSLLKLKNQRSRSDGIELDCASSNRVCSGSGCVDGKSSMSKTLRLGTLGRPQHRCKPSKSCSTLPILGIPSALQLPVLKNRASLSNMRISARMERTPEDWGIELEERNAIFEE